MPASSEAVPLAEAPVRSDQISVAPDLPAPSTLPPSESSAAPPPPVDDASAQDAQLSEVREDEPSAVIPDALAPPVLLPSESHETPVASTDDARAHDEPADVEGLHSSEPVAF
jgi:hypothetical protein